MAGEIDRLKGDLANVPSWVWLGGAAAGGLLFVLKRNSAGSAASTTPATNADSGGVAEGFDQSQQIASLQAAIQQLQAGGTTGATGPTGATGAPGAPGTVVGVPPNTGPGGSGPGVNPGWTPSPLGGQVTTIVPSPATAGPGGSYYTQGNGGVPIVTSPDLATYEQNLRNASGSTFVAPPVSVLNQQAADIATAATPDAGQSVQDRINQLLGRPMTYTNQMALAQLGYKFATPGYSSYTGSGVTPGTLVVAPDGSWVTRGGAPIGSWSAASPNPTAQSLGAVAPAGPQMYHVPVGAPPTSFEGGPIVRSAPPTSFEGGPIVRSAPPTDPGADPWRVTFGGTPPAGGPQQAITHTWVPGSGHPAFGGVTGAPVKAPASAT